MMGALLVLRKSFCGSGLFDPWVRLRPSISAKIRFQDSSYLALFYVLVSTYLGVSAKQIKLGYTVFPGNDVVSKEYSAAGSVAFKSFRLIPYVREMRSILEWMFADTSLDIFMWLKFDDLYAWLLAVRYDKAYRKRSTRMMTIPTHYSKVNLHRTTLIWAKNLPKQVLCDGFGPCLCVSIFCEEATPK